MSDLAEKLILSSKDFQSKIGFQLLDKLPENIQKGWKIADIGCGNGTIALKFSKMVGDEGLVLAIDSNHRRIDYLKERLNNDSSKTRNLVILNQKAENCDFKQYGNFNLIFSNVAMHWIPETNLRAIYQLAFQALAPGGYLAVAVAEMNVQEGGYRSMFYTSLPDEIRKEIFKHVFSRRLEWYVDVVQEAGFTIVDQGYIHQDAIYKNLDDFLNELNEIFENIVPFEKYFTLASIKEAGFYDVNEDGTIFGRGRVSFFIAQKTK